MTRPWPVTGVRQRGHFCAVALLFTVGAIFHQGPSIAVDGPGKVAPDSSLPRSGPPVAGTSTRRAAIPDTSYRLSHPGGRDQSADQQNAVSSAVWTFMGSLALLGTVTGLRAWIPWAAMRRGARTNGQKRLVCLDGERTGRIRKKPVAVTVARRGKTRISDPAG